jgi:hypothetical protein
MTIKDDLYVRRIDTQISKTHMYDVTDNCIQKPAICSIFQPEVKNRKVNAIRMLTSLKLKIKAIGSIS